MPDKKKNDDLSPDQERTLRELIKKEMLSKIQSRIDGEDASILRSIKNLIENESPQKRKAEKAASAALEEKKHDK